jgi:hypothetical protein
MMMTHVMQYQGRDQATVVKPAVSLQCCLEIMWMYLMNFVGEIHDFLSTVLYRVLLHYCGYELSVESRNRTCLYRYATDCRYFLSGHQQTMSFYCVTDEGRLSKACDSLEQYSIQNGTKFRGLHLQRRRNLDTGATRLAAHLRVSGIAQNLMLNYCPFCGTVISPDRYQELSEVENES